MTYMETELLVKPLNNGLSHNSSEIVRLNVGGGIFEVCAIELLLPFICSDLTNIDTLTVRAELQ